MVSHNYDVFRLLCFWYSHQEVCVRWYNTISGSFCIKNGTRQGGVLSPYLFSRYIRDLLLSIIHCNIGCNIGGYIINVLAYADDIVLLAPSWRALQQLIDVLHMAATNIDMLCNCKKTVCMVFNPKCRSKIVAKQFPNFTIDAQRLEFVQEFKYLGHMLDNRQLDDADIRRDIRSMLYRCNVLSRRFYSCSVNVKRMLFRSYCLSLYDVALWTNHTQSSYMKFKSCYIKSTKIFFRYSKYYSVAAMFNELCIPTFEDMIDNYRNNFQRQILRCSNHIISYLRELYLW